MKEKNKGPGQENRMRVSNLECETSKDLKDEPSKERGSLFYRQREECVQTVGDR